MKKLEGQVAAAYAPFDQDGSVTCGLFRKRAALPLRRTEAGGSVRKKIIVF